MNPSSRNRPGPTVPPDTGPPDGADANWLALANAAPERRIYLDLIAFANVSSTERLAHDIGNFPGQKRLGGIGAVRSLWQYHSGQA